MTTQIYCHECDGSFTVDFDESINGNHVVPCPKCGHEHCRVIENGVVTDFRWDRRNGPTYNYIASSTTYVTGNVYVGSSAYTTQSWTDTTTSGSYMTAFYY